MKKGKPKIRKYNKKLKKIDDEYTIIQLEEKLLQDNIIHKGKW